MAILSWFKRPPVPEDGMMSLGDHLRELRYRLVISVLAIVLASTVAAFFWNQLIRILLMPYTRATEMLHQTHPGITTSAVNAGFVAPFTLWLKTCAYTGLIATSPIWLYQLWAFIVPGLVENEKKHALRFLAAAVPLFLLGVGLGWWVLPQGIKAMLTFTPSGLNVTNLVDLNYFFDLTLKTMIAFGLTFLLPILLVGLNLAGVVSAAALGKARRYAWFIAFCITAIITPTSDPFSMLLLAVPLGLLYEGAVLIARVHDHRTAKEVASA